MRFVLLLLTGMFFSACQNSQNNNDFFSDKSASVGCPNGSCSNVTASISSLSIGWSGQRPLLSRASEGTIQLGGDCYASLYPNNRIGVVVKRNTTGYPVLALPATDVAPIGDSTLRCLNGRYNLVLKTANLAAGSSFLLELEQIGIDSAGVEQRNTANSSSKVTIQINRIN